MGHNDSSHDDWQGKPLDCLVNNVYTNGMARKRQQEDPVMAKVHTLFEKSGLSLHDLGIKMGCPPDTARQAVWQFMRTSDPHISVLRRFAKAMGIAIGELVRENRKDQKKFSENRP